jgi:hypothetical protein
VAGEARQPAGGWVFTNGHGQPISLMKFVERVIEPTLEATGVPFKRCMPDGAALLPSSGNSQERL